MIRRKAERAVDVAENRYGGAGQMIMTAILNGQELGDKGRLFTQITLKPGCGIGLHAHDNEWEAYFIMKGSAELTYDGENSTLTEGDVHLCHAGHSHAVHNAGPDNLEFVALILYS